MVDYTKDKIIALHKFYSALDEHIRELEARNKSRINCKKGCFSCCVDDLEVFGIEAANIQQEFGEEIKKMAPAPKGACAFLNEAGACRIYQARPYVCRTHGIPVTYLQEDEEGPFELRDICPLNEKGEPLENLSDENLLNNDFWEEQLTLLQFLTDKGRQHRVKLRSFFT